jgi:hypothetical protein
MLMHNVAAVLVAAVVVVAAVQGRQAAVVAEAVAFPVLLVAVFHALQLHIAEVHVQL